MFYDDDGSSGFGSRDNSEGTVNLFKKMSSLFTVCLPLFLDMMSVESDEIMDLEEANRLISRSGPAIRQQFADSIERGYMLAGMNARDRQGTVHY